MQSIQTNGTLGGAHVQSVHKPKGRNNVWFVFFLTLLVLCIMLLPAGGLFVTQSGPTLISWCYTRRFATTIFSATLRCKVGTMLQQFETTSQQCYNAVLRWKSTLWIVPCNITYSLRRRRNLTPVSLSKVCEAAPISLFWAPPHRTQRITRKAFRISFQPDWQTDNGFLYRPIMARAQILVHRWVPRTRIPALSRRQT